MLLPGLNDCQPQSDRVQALTCPDTGGGVSASLDELPCDTTGPEVVQADSARVTAITSFMVLSFVLHGMDNGKYGLN